MEFCLDSSEVSIQSLDITSIGHLGFVSADTLRIGRRHTRVAQIGLVTSNDVTWIRHVVLVEIEYDRICMMCFGVWTSGLCKWIRRCWNEMKIIYPVVFLD